jgi:simple sugar transport system permease protein
VKLSKRAPITIAVLALITILLAISAPSESTLIRVATDTDIIKLADFAVGVQAIAYGSMAVSLALAAWALVNTFVLKKATPKFIMPVVFVLIVVTVLTSLFSGNTLPISSLLAGSLALAVPLIFGSLAGVLSERVGIVNIAIEGQLLAGAFTSAFVASITDSVWAGVLAASISGALVAWILAVFSIRYKVDQIIVGVVVNVLIIGLTSYLFSTVLSENISELNQPPRFDKVLVPGLGQIPVVGPTLFNQTPIVYLMYLGVAVVFIALFKTRWGLRVRAVGEYPKAADTVGINVFRTRYISVIIGGALAGLGGSFFTLGQVGSFGKEMTNGAGYIALAALIFGRWNPLLAALAALLFGFAQNLQYGLAIIGSPLPSEFLLMLPYALTVVAVAGLVGKVTGPAAAGKVYEKS